MPSKLGFEEGVTDEKGFDLLPERVQIKLWPDDDDSALKIWWADRRRAGVLRREQVGVATKEDQGWRVWVVPLLPDSHIYSEREMAAPHRPAGTGGRGPRLTAAPLRKAPWDGRWPNDFAGFLGNLPTKAQEMLSAGFGHNTVRPEYVWSYRRDRHPEGDYEQLDAFCVMVDPHQAVFVHGVRQVPMGMEDPFAPGPAKWVMSFYSAKRAPKPGSGVQVA
ncbi:hypothetical protein [uncultured Pseudokineococcus sp.]|uniref:hypothetical protein n=1 Tax=uncultured Pseudokineococcus sp. TaxID=1642928 RepID=UPI00262BEFB5|nr:hypothetical protein [uncultured Pseudokineococcus sp.]